MISPTVQTLHPPGEEYLEIVLCQIVFSIVNEFAASNDRFIEEFSEVYTKLLSTGYESLQSVD